MTGMPVSDVEHGTRTPFAIDGEREVRCLLKGGQVIAAIRCVDEQKEGCFCPAAFGALRALEALCSDPNRANETLHETEPATRAKWRIDLVQLKARATGFLGKKQEFAGAALSHMNREQQRKVEQRQALGRASVPQKPVVVSRVSPDAAEERRARIAEAVEGQRAERRKSTPVARTMHEMLTAAGMDSGPGQNEERKESHKGPGASGNRVAREEGVATSRAGGNPGTRDVAMAARPGAVSAEEPEVGPASVTAGASRWEDRSGEPDGRRGSAEGGPPTPAAAANRAVPHTVCKGLPGRPCTKILRRCSRGERCVRCNVVAEHDAYPTCPKCQRKSKELPGGICRRCTASSRLPRGPQSPAPPRGELSEQVEAWRAQGLELRKALEVEQWQLLARLDDVKKLIAALPPK